MGWGESFYLTAVGDTVHVAARLEQATKDYRAELVLSEEVARYAAVDLSAFPRHDLEVHNRAGRVGVRVISRSPTFTPFPGWARPAPENPIRQDLYGPTAMVPVAARQLFDLAGLHDLRRVVRTGQQEVRPRRRPQPGS